VPDCLSSLLSTISGDTVLWRYGRELFTAERLKESVKACQAQGLPKAAQVAIEAEDVVSALTWLIALDGMVSSVFLVPLSLLRSSEYEVLRAKAGCTHVVSTGGVREISKAAAFDNEEVAIGTNWILATSGTTGTPKLIKHTTASLTRTCKKDIRKGAEFIWGLVYDPFRFAGLQVVLQSFFSGSCLVICDPQMSIKDTADSLTVGKVNALSATPSFWRKLLMSGEAKCLRLKQITLGGESADQSVLDALARAYPDARIAHIYASTEAGVGFSIRDGKAGFPASMLRDSGPFPHFTVGPEGTLLIRVQSDLASESIDGAPLQDQGFIDSGDLVELSGDRVFFLGRDSGAINVGGNKVIPEQVESVIRAVPGVAEVVVKPKASGVMGQLVVAEVVPEQSDMDKKVLKKNISAYCRENLHNYQVPALIRFVDQVQVNMTGKIKRT
jgi:acyl-CoA synthetase (AMP-forming)/AMP-acid ligase II